MKGAAVLLGALLLVLALSLMLGEVMLSPVDLARGLVTGEGPAALTIRVIRGPRALAALGAGAALGLSGAIFQTLLRNPLASPDIMGFTSGAGLAVVVAVAFGLVLPLPLVAAGGGLATAALVVALSHRRGQALAPLTLILVGLGVGFTASAFASFLVLRLPVAEASEAQRWVSGSLAARRWSDVAQVWGIGAGLALLLAAQLQGMKLLELGRDLATGLGLRAERALWGLVATGVLLAAAGVAVAGPIPFVALMAPPIGAMLTGARTPGARFAAAAGTGAAIVTLADLLARIAIPGIQLPVGVATGLLGAPYLLWRLSREMEGGRL
ncbi:iron chelate uptake ABC transporter family permease subunit [Aureimonas sp. ME7]|uniref:iron chelate uptake ABC transporter family permease subunit n=1 Tax=Aureimonas sp. ME7 TaxID=2744252 RepID=UPI0015F42949|nr:iron chelate uptake ABC transporter family permease subunit [Aureimonas sp. ME7]